MTPQVLTPRRLQTLQWYARRPRLWKQFIRMLSERMTERTRSPVGADPKRVEATHWCESVAVSLPEAMHRATGSRVTRSLAAECPADVAHGHELQRSCPVKMGSGADVDLVYSLACAISCVHAVETGVAFGWSSFAVLQAVAQRQGHLTSTDMPYPLRNNDAFVGCVVPVRLRPFWTLLRAPDRDALPTALRRSGALDLCHYDSDKSEAGRAWAYPLLWHALRPGGIFVTDDVQDNLVYARFAASVGREPLVARVPERGGFKYSGILVR